METVTAERINRRVMFVGVCAHLAAIVSLLVLESRRVGGERFVADLLLNGLP